MLVFIERTWLVWWMLAVLFILRWFRVFSADSGAESLNPPVSGQTVSGQVHEEDRIVSGQIPASRTSSSPVADGAWL
jgi:hypothetical protein